MSQISPSCVQPEEDTLDDLRAQVVGLMKQRDMAITICANKDHVIRGLEVALSVSENAKEQLKGRIKNLSERITYLEKLPESELTKSLLEEAIARVRCPGAFSSSDNFVDKVETLLWGKCNHDFGGKCPRCYPPDRK